MEKHYHYLVSYIFELKNNTSGFGGICIERRRKINNTTMDLLREEVFKSAKKYDDAINNIVILTIFPLECGCESEENENARK